MRIEKNINKGIISWCNTTFSKLTLQEMYGRQQGESLLRSWWWIGQRGNDHQLNPLTPKISLEILFTVLIQFLWCCFGEFGNGSAYNSLAYNILYSLHLSAWYCLDIVRRNSLLVTHGSQRVNPSTPHSD